METQVVAGIHLPVRDTHFKSHLLKEPLFYGKGTYQYAKIDAALKIVPEDRRKLALDVGAHVGMWTRVLSYHFQRVCAFEPLPEHAHCWWLNQDHLHAVELYEKALGTADGRVNMRRYKDNSGNAHVSTQLKGDHFTALTSIDAVAAQKKWDRVDFIKIDVEGYELPVVLGGEATIRTHRPIMVVEQKPNNAERCGFKTGKVLEVLKSWGYDQVWQRSGDHCLRFKGE